MKAKINNLKVESYTIQDVARAIAVVQCYSSEKKIARFDDIDRDQPNLLGAALQLAKLDPPLPMPMVDRVLDVLLVLYELTLGVNPEFPEVRYDCVSKEFDRLNAMEDFLNGESPAHSGLWIQQMAKDHREQFLFAWLVDRLLESFGKDEGRDAETARRCCVVMMNACVRTKWGD
jgi:hypothetical protein